MVRNLISHEAWTNLVAPVLVFSFFYYHTWIFVSEISRKSRRQPFFTFLIDILKYTAWNSYIFSAARAFKRHQFNSIRSTMVVPVWKDTTQYLGLLQANQRIGYNNTNHKYRLLISYFRQFNQKKLYRELSLLGLKCSRLLTTESAADKSVGKYQDIPFAFFANHYQEHFQS